MRILILLRGIPASGKSTFIKKYGLEKFVVSPDSFRLDIQAPIMNLDGTMGISQGNDNVVWKHLMKVVERRMQRGDFTVVDATHSKKDDIAKYKKLKDLYRYRMYVVDFSDVPLDVALERNRQRESYKFVPEHVLHYMHERMVSVKMPSYVTVIKPDEFEQVMQYRNLDLSGYSKIHHFGDIHGCFDPLNEYLADGIKDDEFYIFTGDYVDRGIQNKEVMEYIISIMDRKNVVFLEGNHEIHLWHHATGEYVKSRRFRDYTAKEIEDIDKSDIRKFYRNILQGIIYEYDDKKVLVTHGGLSNMPENMLHICTKDLIHGIGQYDDSVKVAEYFNENTDENTYQIHGHRNIEDYPMRNGRTFNLCDKIEFGGNLRILTLDKNGFDEIMIKNDVFETHEKSITTSSDSSIEEVLAQFDANPHLISKYETEDGIVSYGFKSKVFYNQLWDNITVKARGFFIDKYTREIISRSYEKFFNIDERNIREASMDYLKGAMIFPIHAYVKENGFLGIVGYRKSNDTIVTSSKSRVDGEFADYFNKIFYDTIDESNLEAFKRELDEKNISAVFEVNDPINDPHIIKYDRQHIVLLDLVKRTMNYEKLPYDEVSEFASRYGFKHKEHAYTLDNWDEFEEWHRKVNAKNFMYKGKHIEGFVVEDSEGKMVKEKLEYYKYWKHLRGMKDKLKKSKNGGNRQVRTGSLLDNNSINFYGWMNTLTVDELNTDIISLREKWEGIKD